MPLDGQIEVVVSPFKKGDRKMCFKYIGIRLLSLPGKVYTEVLGSRVRQEVECQIQVEQCGFPGRGRVDRLFTLDKVLEGTRVFAQPVYMCFLYLEKPFGHVPRGPLWGVL